MQRRWKLSIIAFVILWYRPLLMTVLIRWRSTPWKRFWLTSSAFRNLNIHIQLISIGNGCLSPLLTILWLYHMGKFYIWRNSEYEVKTMDLSLLTDIQYVQTGSVQITLLVVDIDCVSWCRSNYRKARPSRW